MKGAGHHVSPSYSDRGDKAIFAGVGRETPGASNAVIACPHDELLGINKKRNGEKRGEWSGVRGGGSDSPL